MASNNREIKAFLQKLSSGERTDRLTIGSRWQKTSLSTISSLICSRVHAFRVKTWSFRKRSVFSPRIRFILKRAWNWLCLIWSFGFYLIRKNQAQFLMTNLYSLISYIKSKLAAIFDISFSFLSIFKTKHEKSKCCIKMLKRNRGYFKIRTKVRQPPFLFLYFEKGPEWNKRMHFLESGRKK